MLYQCLLQCVLKKTTLGKRKGHVSGSGLEKSQGRSARRTQTGLFLPWPQRPPRSWVRTDLDLLEGGGVPEMERGEAGVRSNSSD